MGAVYTLQGEGWWSNWIACDFLFGPYVMDLYLSIFWGAETSEQESAPSGVNT